MKTVIFWFETFSSYLRAATGWRRAGLAFVFGGLMSLTMPPYDFFPLLWLCLPALIFLLQGVKNKKQAFAAGWWFAFGFLMFGLYWIAAAMFVDIKAFWWGIPLAVAGLPAGFAIYYGIAALLAYRIGTTGISGAIGFALLWFLADYARGHMFTGFPWNLVGYAWSGALPVLQVTSVTGIYGLTLLTLLAAALPACMGSKAGRRASVGGIILFALMGLGGEARLHNIKTSDVPDVRLRLVQPDIAQARKWLASKREADFEGILNLTSAPVAPGEKPVTHVVWPETASTYYLSEDDNARAAIAEHIPAAASVITGVIRRAADKDGTTHYYNSLVAVDGLGRLVAGYDKVHLVPFGEYMPWRKYNPLRTLAASGADFTSGDGLKSLRVLGLPSFSPLICYEAIFPGEVIDRDDRPDFMVNITNDGWYGNSIGPYQHFAIVRVRAIEEGLPLVRAANTGISGVIDPVGRIKARLGLGKRGFIDSDLPGPLPPTIFARWGEMPLWVVFLWAALAWVAIRRSGRYN